ncbi:MAG TPA: FUSC family protein [Gaiellaceae bacterium]|nr:FUSC family protein [Gaiellaceae bacterium]
MALGGTVAWWLAVELGARRPIFAALVPLVAMTGDPFAAVSVTLGRIVGVFAGVGIGIAFIHADVSSTARVALVLLVGTIGSVLLRVGSRPNLEVPIAGLFMLGVATSTAGRFGVQRIWETAIGGGVAILVSAFLWPPDPVRELRRQLDRLRRALVEDLTRIAADLATGAGETAEQMDAVRANSLDAVRDVFELASARQALRWSPLRRGDVPEVDELESRINLAARVYRHTRSIARDVTDVPVVDAKLAAATRDLTDAVDRLLTGADPSEPLGRAAAALDGSGSIVGVQLRQLLADLRASVEG